MIALTRSDASHLHDKPLQLQPRVVRVPPSAPTEKQGRMSWLRAVVGIRSCQPHSKQQELHLRSSNEGPVFPSMRIYYTRFMSPCRIHTTSPCAEHYMGHPSLARSRVLRDDGADSSTTRGKASEGIRIKRKQPSCDRINQLGPQLHSVSNWTFLGKENSLVFWIYV